MSFINGYIFCRCFPHKILVVVSLFLFVCFFLNLWICSSEVETFWRSDASGDVSRSLVSFLIQDEDRCVCLWVRDPQVCFFCLFFVFFKNRLGPNGLWTDLLRITIVKVQLPFHTHTLSNFIHTSLNCCFLTECSLDQTSVSQMFFSEDPRFKNHKPSRPKVNRHYL